MNRDTLVAMASVYVDCKTTDTKAKEEYAGYEENRIWAWMKAED